MQKRRELLLFLFLFSLIFLTLDADAAVIECGLGQIGCANYTTIRKCILIQSTNVSIWSYEKCQAGKYCNEGSCIRACGNGRVDNRTGEHNANYGETCDDGPFVQSSGCSMECKIEYGFTCSGEPSICNLACGNGKKDYDEQCDDGNFADNDGCDSGCKIQSGFTCKGFPSVCTYCGNLKLEADEQCDDGNKISGDCCSSECKFEDLGSLECGTGECRNTTQKCTNGKINYCLPKSSSLEICDGKDNDCDSLYDETLSAPNCALTFGICQGAKKICGGASGWLDCTEIQYGSEYQAIETRCDGNDNDCDNAIDESLLNSCMDYSTCIAYSSCAACPSVPAEKCDGIDNDCDGNPDEGCSCLDGVTRKCGYNELGICRMGVQSCVSGAWTDCIDSIMPRDEICDEIDNNCDGNIDEGLSNECKDYNTCNSFRSCSACLSAPAEICDGRDNNCDGNADENLANCCATLGAVSEGCIDDERCPGIYGKQVCENYEWSKCRADCPIELNNSLFSGIRDIESLTNLPPISKTESICEGYLTKTLDLEGFDSACDYKTDSMRGYLAAPKQLKIDFPIGTTHLFIKCGNLQQEIIYEISSEINCSSSSRIADFKQIINDFIDEGIITEEESVMAKRTAEVVSEKTSYSIKEDAALVTHTITSKENISNMEFRLYIPKECANSTKTIQFHLPNYTVLNEDPLIAWHFTDVKDTIDLSYRLSGDIGQECLSKIKGLPIGRISESAKYKKINFAVPFFLLLVFLAAGAYSFSPKFQNLFSGANAINRERRLILNKLRTMDFKSKEEVLWYLKKEETDEETIQWIMQRL